jgi:putative nucleotidyltransferase with HDIG domain
MKKTLEEALAGVKPISPALIKLVDVTADARHSLQDVLEVIRFDSVLTAQLLRAANSAAFRRSEPVDSLDMAISLLGERFVVGLAMELRSDGFFDRPLVGYESEAGDLWRHGIKTALAARLLCRYSQQPIDGGLAFTAGILHDIGKVVLSGLLEGETADMVASVGSGQDHLSFLGAEREKLGYDHCEAGAALAEKWRLPACYCEAIRWHHQPARSQPECVPLVYAVHVGDALAMMAGAGTGADCLLYPLDAAVNTYLKLDDESIPRVLLEMDREYSMIAEAIATD